MPARELTWDAPLEMLTWVGAKACADIWHLHILEGRLHLWQIVEPDSLAPQAFAEVYGERLADRLGIDLLAISICDDRRASQQVACLHDGWPHSPCKKAPLLIASFASGDCLVAVFTSKAYMCWLKVLYWLVNCEIDRLSDWLDGRLLAWLTGCILGH